MLVTLVDNAASASVDIPWTASVMRFKTLRTGSYAGHYIETEGLDFAGVNKNPSDMLKRIKNKRTLACPLDGLIVPQNKGHDFEDALKNPKNMDYYTLAWDEPTGKVIQLMFNNGPLSLGTVVVGQGEDMTVIECPTQVSSSFDTEEDGVQRLRTYPVIGDLIQERANVTVDEASGSVDDVDVGTWAESMTEMTHPTLRHDAGLKYCGVFGDYTGGNDNGPNPEHPGPADELDFGRQYLSLLRDYNEDNNGEKHYLATPFGQLHDNNTPPPGTSKANSLRDMHNWRQHYSIVGVYKTGGAIRIAHPKRLGHVSLRGLHPNTVYDAVLKIEKVLQTRKINVNDAFARVHRLGSRSTFGNPAADLDAMDIDAPVSQSVFEQDRTALANVNSQRDIGSALGHLARGPGSFLEHARHIPDSHMDAFIGFYKAALGQLHGLAGSDQLATATENFNNRLSDLQTLRGQGPLLEAVTRASDKINNNASLATWNTRLYQNADIKTKVPLKGAVFSLDGTLKQQPVAQQAPMFGIPNKPLGAVVADIGADEATDLPGAYEAHIAAANTLGLTGDQDRIYTKILALPFTYHHLSRLYRVFGVSLFNINRYRNRQYYEMCAISGFVRDRSYITMFTHPQARSGIDYIHGMVSETIEFRSSVIPLEPETTMIKPYAFCNRLMNEINCRPARNQEEARSTDPDAPSLICTMVPKDEYDYDFPMSFMGNDIHEHKPMSKKSDTPFLRKLLDEQWLEHQSATRANPVTYDKNGIFSDIIHRSWKLEMRAGIKDPRPVNGTGPRAETFVNCSEAHSVWVNASARFPVQLEVCTFVRREINV